ncbi:Cell division cycle-related protein res1/sct1 like [Verticillium longisporum]|nr:Cell division cycle-related protein res1/sct1 like [Verticillium longisporum]
MRAPSASLGPKVINPRMMRAVSLCAFLTMAKGPAAAPAQSGIYSATYSGVPVYEFQFGDDLKEHVMRRRQDNWINATHILKAAGFDKPARTRILEREVQKEKHEKVQGGYGKYQGTWIPLNQGQQLAQRNNCYDRIHPIFEYTPGNESPPPAPRHTSKPKAPKRPAVPKWPVAPTASQETFDAGDSMMHDDDTPDNITIASASYMGEDDRFDMSQQQQPTTGHRKRKREEAAIQDMTQQQHSVYGDELLDYFLLSRNEKPAHRPEPPPNFLPNWVIDTESHTALHWASAMGDVEVIKQLKRFNADLAVLNVRGETPLMRAVHFTNCYDKETFPMIVRELFDTINLRDHSGATVIHHAATMKNGRVTSHSCARYYLEVILTKLQEAADPQFIQQLIDAQDHEGNTALHLAAERNARKCIRALLGRNASTNIPNADGVHAEDLIRDLNASKKEQRGPHRSSSPFGPESHRHVSFRDALTDQMPSKPNLSYDSEAANSVHSRIAPLIFEKFSDLSASYDEELRSKVDAERDARRAIAANQTELSKIQQQIAELDAKAEADEDAAKVASEANLAKHQVMSLITNQNRLHIQQYVDQELSLLNGDVTDGSYEERLELALKLHASVNELRQSEADYVDALSMVGIGENVDKYRRLLRQCLDPKDAENLDSNLDSLVDMMEEDHDISGDMQGAGVEPVDVSMGLAI